LSNDLSNQLLKELFGQQSGDPFLMLVTLSHDSFPPIRFVSNSEDIVSRGETYTAFPINIRLPADDGETLREVNMEFDNVSLELIDEIRTITTPLDAKIEMVLASRPNDVEIALEELKLVSVTYNENRVRARLIMDNFLDVEMTSEKYTPTTYSGLF